MKTYTTETGKTDRRKASYTDRPLTEEERVFAADAKNYNLLFWYMRLHKLDQEEWYDILIIPYLDCVKKYHEYGLADRLAFSTVFERKMYTAVTDEYKRRKRKKRMPEGGFCSLDYTLEDDRMNHESRIEEWWTDKKTNIEKQVIFKDLFREFYQKCITIIDDFDGESFVSEYLKCELDLLIEGYSEYQTWRKTEKQYPYGYTLYNLERDIDGFRRVFKEVFGF